MLSDITAKVHILFYTLTFLLDKMIFTLSFKGHSSKFGGKIPKNSHKKEKQRKNFISKFSFLYIFYTFANS